MLLWNLSKLIIGNKSAQTNAVGLAAEKTRGLNNSGLGRRNDSAEVS